jgi:hypothetical protein
MPAFAASIYVLCSYVWGALCLGVCAYLVFWNGESGWWFLLGIFLACNETAKNASKIAGTYKAADWTDDK